jgi:hypothetical protein
LFFSQGTPSSRGREAPFSATALNLRSWKDNPLTIEIGQNGEVSVSGKIKGTYADPTLPLHERIKRLARYLGPGNEIPALLCEAADILQSNRIAAERRGKMQLQTQTSLHDARLEISFLRNFIREKLGTSPDFVQPSPWETEARRKAEVGDHVTGPIVSD